ncbi:hypothetical protein [Psychrobacillus vulpis]|uniref:Uncharacterized protein n=1 Tax=Psychrobacillus vulpis TaxID=2325572 RepID=A0A544TPQ7_9BACI|nr:hypothetical protein [Psychrobacillus vulpis]TQR19409.1 hypothetical protein FG384_12215 [Psychrobacillus vulpis]
MDIFRATKYEFIDSTVSFVLGAVAIGITGSIYTLLHDENKVKRIFKRLMIVYVVSLMIFTAAFYSCLPTYTYKEAGAKIENETGEKKIETKEIKRSIGHYIIYTKDGIYLLNPNTGEFVKRADE